jgi:hypothetical protein
MRRLASLIYISVYFKKKSPGSSSGEIILKRKGRKNGAAVAVVQMEQVGATYVRCQADPRGRLEESKMGESSIHTRFHGSSQTDPYSKGKIRHGPAEEKKTIWFYV